MSYVCVRKREIERGGGEKRERNKKLNIIDNRE
jgi:hypothetical protein